ncbi:MULTISPECIES: phospholipase D-like domain-containing protein [Rufibacter]|uniref:phospholipase D n=1 Tax=Rufibacter quisquiliarum TaxID=1549639 RepID=A0A839GP22_9BACT|nr:MULTISPECIES: phospholipase D-like domain-containing protein [Rufibacter]MBA9076656.1 phosphatidylserine/phosphatidylglycerophosphate/cardiolipin synthase-like enzyme [Rufibacter quisquiliarum]
MKRITLLYIIFLLCTGCSSSEDASPEPVDPGAGKPFTIELPAAAFTNLSKVGSGLASPDIMNQLIALVDAAPANANIHLSIFIFNYQALTDALKRASDRGVKLHLMLDFSRDESLADNPATISQLRGFLKPTSELVLITSDASGSSINHNKFVLFSEITTATGKQQNVVFQTSHNFTLSDSKKIQDALIFPNAGLYGAYLSYWTDMKEKAGSGMKNFFYREYHDEAAGISALFFPKRRNGTSYGADTAIEILEGLTEPATATVRVSMSDWTATRLNVVDKLIQLREQGATIEVIAKDKVDPEILTGLQRLKSKGALVKIYSMAQTNNHSKFMLITGQWKGAQVNLLVTGSHNFTVNALRNNNEAMILLKNHPTLFNTYLNYYSDMKKIPSS